MREIEKCHLTVTSRRHTTTCSLQKCCKLASQLSRFQGIRRSSGRSRHANHPGSSPAVPEKNHPTHSTQKIGPPFFSFPPYFFKVADLRFNTFLDTKRAIRRCWRSLRSLKMLPIDSPSNFTLNGMFDPHFRKRSLAKIKKIPKNRNPSRKKNRDLNRISPTLSNRHSLVSVYSLTLSLWTL